MLCCSNTNHALSLCDVIIIHWTAKHVDMDADYRLLENINFTFQLSYVSIALKQDIWRMHTLERA